MTDPRLLSGADAAAYCGVTAATFAKWVSDGRAPKPLPGTRRWDRKAIDLALDKASGISPAAEREDVDAAFTKWEQTYDARKAEAPLTKWKREQGR
jgi:predicted DNA-binding transcriptional regulator AlpA